MNTELLEPNQLAQYKADCLLADTIEALGISTLIPTNLRNLIPTKRVEELFLVVGEIVPPGDDDILRFSAIQILKQYSMALKAQFLKEQETPIVHIPVPITLADISEAEALGWVFVKYSDRYNVTKGMQSFSISQTIDVTEFKTILNII